MKATFTLTNAVPQFQASNSGPWQEFETKIRDYAKNICGQNDGTLFLLTGRSENGIIPDPQNPYKVVKDTSNTVPKLFTVETFGGVTLKTPRSIWTAGCCVWEEPGWVFRKFWPVRKAQSFAVMSNNQKDKTKLHQTKMSVRELEELLRAPAAAVNLFPGDENCRRHANNIETIKVCVASGSCLATSAQVIWNWSRNCHWFQVSVINNLNRLSGAGFLYSLEYLFLLLLILLAFRDRKQRRLQQQRKPHPKIGFAVFHISSLLFHLF